MYQHFIKPILDFLISLFGLIILSPVILLITVILFISHRSNPFFIQSRPGKNEKIFKVIKFKTMNDRKDSEGNLLPDAQRLTIIGNFIRKTSLDEIPQLLNVLKGDMSIIGPRPLLVDYLLYYSENEIVRHSIRPGITGLAQVSGRNTLDWNKRLELDAFYARNVSLKLDLKIFFLTIMKVLKQEDVIVVPSKRQVRCGNSHLSPTLCRFQRLFNFILQEVAFYFRNSRSLA